MGQLGMAWNGAHAVPAVAAGTSVSALVVDARLDNRSELARRLDLSATQCTDRALIAAAYEQWGQECVNYLVGDFAIALWDARRQELFCARDPMGVKPFYYARSGSRFAFASEPKALLSLGYVTRDLDEEQIALFLGWRADERVRTMYSAIDRLPAAHALTVSAHRTMSSRYWSVDSLPDVRFSSDSQYVEAFRERFSEAVRVRCESDGPVAAALSGGLDSSAIVCEARRQLGRLPGRAPELHTISLIFPDAGETDRTRIDERAYAEEVTRDGGVRAHFVRGDQLSPLAELTRVLAHVDEPYFTPNLYLHWAMYGAAQREGARVFLDGFDGDAVVSHGFGRLNSLARAAAWDRFEAEVRAFTAHRRARVETVLPHFGLPVLSDLARRGRAIAWCRAASELARRFGVSRREMAWRYGLEPVVPSMMLRAWRASRRAAPSVEDVLLRRTLARRIRHAVKVAGASPPGAPERVMHREAISQPGYQLTLEIADKSAAAFGIEPRYPFFDRRLIEFCVGLPEEQKFADGWPRLILRRAMQGVLPSAIQWRSTKADLSSNFRRRLLTDRGTTMNGADLSVLAPYLHVDRLRERLARFGDGAGMSDADAEACLLFRAVVLAAWLNSVPGPGRAVPVPCDPQAPVAT